MVQEILSSCLKLERFAAWSLDARHVVDGKPWVCRCMVEFSVLIDFEPAAAAIAATTFTAAEAEGVEMSQKSSGTCELEIKEMTRLQRRVFGQMSVMRNICHLWVGYENHRWEGPSLERRNKFRTGLDFRFSVGGLEQWQGFTQLTSFSYKDTRQSMTRLEVDWMKTHWKCLHNFRGPFDTADPKRNSELLYGPCK